MLGFSKPESLISGPMNLISRRMTNIPPRMTLISGRMTLILLRMTLIHGQKTRISRRMTLILGQMILILRWMTQIFRGEAPLFNPIRKENHPGSQAGGMPGHVIVKESSRFWWIDLSGSMATIKNHPSSLR